jgi:hypothetical protein
VQLVYIGEAISQPAFVIVAFAVFMLVRGMNRLKRREEAAPSAPTTKEMNYFVQNGIAPSSISIIGYGESRPIADNDTPSGKARNRRVELNPIQ